MRYLAALLLFLGGASAPLRGEELPRDSVARLRAYIRESWDTLTRSLRDLPQAAPDPKMSPAADGRWPIYVSRRESLERVRGELVAAIGEDRMRQFDLRTLPADPLAVREHGLLFLPKPYVVPGGRFNEMYGWDSFFIQLGLLRDGRVELARDLVDNFVYEIEHYGTLLNANRTYYLTRSQPPFLTRMILGVFHRTGDRAWLAGTLAAIDAYSQYWTTGAHVVPGLGLSRYHDAGRGPTPESLSHERDEQGRTHYERVREYYRSHEVPDYDLSLYYDRVNDRLTDLFYEGDRAMRESGFDTSDRFGPFGVAAVHHAPVCLNALLYQMERDAGEIHEALGGAEKAREWRARASRRREAVDRYLWDEERGLYFDYDFVKGRRRVYEFATAFFPLWTGMASPQQAQRVFDNLARFEAPGGILTSTRESGSQWDAPFGWAPLQIAAAQGLARYGYETAARRIAGRFVALVAKEFEEHGTVVEKYDVVRRESDVAAGLRFGYASNEVGFGWTNAAVLELLALRGELR